MSTQKGIMLIELLIVIMIIGLLITGAVKTWDTVVSQARFNNTNQEMQELVYAIVGNPELVSDGRRTDFGYVGDIGALPDSLYDLVNKPSYVSDSCWRGPYIRAKFSENQDDYIFDAWGNRYIYHKESLFIRSYTTGTNLTPNKWITKKIARSENDLLRNTINGYVRDLTGNPPRYFNQYIRIYITYPYNGIMWTPAGYIPDSSGYFTIYDVPQGNHRLFCVFDTTLLNPADTTDYAEKYVCVYPGIPNSIDFKLSVKF